MTRLVELIETEERKGQGTAENPVRLCSQLWTKEGVLIAEFDPFLGFGTMNPSGLRADRPTMLSLMKT